MRARMRVYIRVHARMYAHEGSIIGGASLTK